MYLIRMLSSDYTRVSRITGRIARRAICDPVHTVEASTRAVLCMCFDQLVNLLGQLTTLRCRRIVGRASGVSFRVSRR